MEDYSEIDEFCNNIIKKIENTSTEYYVLPKEIKFKLAVIKKKQIGGGIKFLVADAKGKYNKDTITQIEFTFPRKGKPINVNAYSIRKTG